MTHEEAWNAYLEKLDPELVKEARKPAEPGVLDSAARVISTPFTHYPLDAYQQHLETKGKKRQAKAVRVLDKAVGYGATGLGALGMGVAGYYGGQALWNAPADTLAAGLKSIHKDINPENNSEVKSLRSNPLPFYWDLLTDPTPVARAARSSAVRLAPDVLRHGMLLNRDAENTYTLPWLAGAIRNVTPTGFLWNRAVDVAQKPLDVENAAKVVADEMSKIKTDVKNNHIFNVTNSPLAMRFVRAAKQEAVRAALAPPPASTPVPVPPQQVAAAPPAGPPATSQTE